MMTIDRYPDVLAPWGSYTATAFYALKRLPRGLVRQLHRNERWDDIRAWVFVAVLEAREQGLDWRGTYNLAQRKIYQALKAEGYKRSTIPGLRGMYVRHEIPVTEEEMRLIVEKPLYKTTIEKKTEVK